MVFNVFYEYSAFSIYSIHKYFSCTNCIYSANLQLFCTLYLCSIQHCIELVFKNVIIININKTILIRLFWIVVFTGSAVWNRNTSCCIRSFGWHGPEATWLPYITRRCCYAATSFGWNESSLESFKIEKHCNQVCNIKIENNFFSHGYALHIICNWNFCTKLHFIICTECYDAEYPFEY